MKILKNVFVTLMYVIMLALIMVYFTGNGVFIYEGV